MWASACVASGLLLCNPVMAVSTENLLFLEAWRGVDRAYVDKSFNNQNWLQVECPCCVLWQLRPAFSLEKNISERNP